MIKLRSLQSNHVAQKEQEINSARHSKIENAIDPEKNNEEEQKTIFIKELQEDL